MNNYLDGLSKAIGEQYFIELSFYAFGVLIALILVIISIFIIKFYVNKKVFRIKTFSMSFDDLENMRRTGLISDLEYARIRSGLIRHSTKELQTENEKTKAKGHDLSATPSIQKSKKTFQTPPDMIGISPSPASSSSQKPLDIDDLLKKGLISEEEYQTLNEIAHKKTSPR